MRAMGAGHSSPCTDLAWATTLLLVLLSRRKGGQGALGIIARLRHLLDEPWRYWHVAPLLLKHICSCQPSDCAPGLACLPQVRLGLEARGALAAAAAAMKAFTDSMGYAEMGLAEKKVRHQPASGR